MTAQPHDIFAEFSGYTEEQAAQELAALGAGTFYKWKEGDNKLRILPRKGGSPFVEWHRHMIEVPDPEGGVDKNGEPLKIWLTFRCLRKHGGGRCPACERGEAILEHGGTSYAARAAAKEAAREYWSSQRAQVVVIDRTLGDTAEPQIAEFPKGLYQKVLALAADKDKGGVFWHPGDGGYDLTINYDKKRPPADMYQPFLSRKASPLHPDPEQALLWLQTAPDITMPGNTMTAAEVEEMLPPLTLQGSVARLPTVPNHAAQRALGNSGVVRPPSTSTFGRPAGAVGRTAQDDLTGEFDI